MRTHVVLGGGLGNQLFQLAAGLSVMGQGKLVLETGILTPGSQLETELNRLHLPENVIIQQKQNVSNFEKRLISFCIREGTKSHTLFTHNLLELIASIGVSVVRRRIFKVFINRGIGFDYRLATVGSNTLLVGYFQCYEWPAKVSSTLRKSFSSLGVKFSNMDYNTNLPEEFNLLHVRLGDYMNENGFGIPGMKYFARALEHLYSNVIDAKERELVIFSDSPDLLKGFIDAEILENSHIHDGGNLSPIETLNLMSKAKNFIISNSTFSWWAAYLSQDENRTVIAPKPWFSRISPPKALIPSEWHTEESFFKK
jgi:hypothetical protein